MGTMVQGSPATGPRDYAGAVARCPVIEFDGVAWRAFRYRPGRTATDHDHSLRFPGRWHMGGSAWLPDRRFGALYTSTGEQGPRCALEEMRRHPATTSPDGPVLGSPAALILRPFVFAELRVRLGRVVDFRVLPDFGWTDDDLYGTPEDRAPQRLAEIAYTRGAEGVLVRSAAKESCINLVIYPGNPHGWSPASVFEPTGQQVLYHDLLP